MSATVIFLLIVIGLVGIPWLVLLLEPKNGRAAILRQLRTLASSLDFDLDYAEAWEKGGIGLDLAQRKVLVLPSGPTSKHLLCELSGLSACRVETRSKYVSLCLCTPDGQSTWVPLFRARQLSAYRKTKKLRRIERWCSMIQKAIEGKRYPL